MRPFGPSSGSCREGVIEGADRGGPFAALSTQVPESQPQPPASFPQSRAHLCLSDPFPLSQMVKLLHILQHQPERYSSIKPSQFCTCLALVCLLPDYASSRVSVPSAQRKEGRPGGASPQRRKQPRQWPFFTQVKEKGEGKEGGGAGGQREVRMTIMHYKYLLTTYLHFTDEKMRPREVK